MPSSTRPVSVKVTAYGIWQWALGAKSLKLETYARTIQGLLGDLAKASGNDIKGEVLKPNGDLKDFYKIFINGRNCETLENIIKDGDDVILFSVIDGG